MSKIFLLSTLLCLLCVGAMFGEPEEAGAAAKPNYLIVMTDDMDARQLNRVPKTQNHLVRSGLRFTNAFATAPQCCPSRASTFTGKYVHNHGVLDTTADYGAVYFHKSGQDRKTINVALDRAGYETMLIGKWLNQYSGKYIPPGWDRWRGQIGYANDHRYNVNGTVEYYDPEKYADTDLFSNWSNNFLENRNKSKPFFLYVGVNAPHGGTTVPDRHEGAFRNAPLPKPPNFNEADVSDKPEYIRETEKLNAEEIKALTKHYRYRARSLLAVDEMVQRLIRTLKETGEMDETYVIFTSDHGYHLGNHRLAERNKGQGGKTRPYEEDIKVPFVVRGPGVPNGTDEHLLINSDVAPTMAELSGVSLPEADGHSAAALLRGEEPASWRKRFLIEFHYGRKWAGYRSTGEKYIVNATGEKELYNLSEDPHELRNVYGSAGLGLAPEADATLESLKTCAGDSCREAEGF